MPLAAISSMFGVNSTGCPSHPRQSPRCCSVINKIMFGCCFISGKYRVKLAVEKAESILPFYHPGVNFLPEYCTSLFISDFEINFFILIFIWIISSFCIPLSAACKNFFARQRLENQAVTRRRAPRFDDGPGNPGNRSVRQTADHAWNSAPRHGCRETESSPPQRASSAGRSEAYDPAS